GEDCGGEVVVWGAVREAEGKEVVEWGRGVTCGCVEEADNDGDWAGTVVVVVAVVHRRRRKKVVVVKGIIVG
ncbi:hypothetical protein Tco_1443624, partial [Tanacetum coccineum]